MTAYPRTPFRAFFGIAAVAMTVLTFVLAVGVPSSIAPADQHAVSFAASKRTAGAIEVAIIPARIDVVGVRDTTLADRQPKPRV